MDLPEIPASPIRTKQDPISITLYVLSAIGLILFIILSVMGIISWVGMEKAKKKEPPASSRPPSQESVNN
jgi:hypothetical protein